MAIADCSTRSKYEDATIRRALRIIENKLREPGPAMSGPASMRNYLVLRLAGLEHEVFTAVFLDAQNRVIVVEELFRGTLTQTAVYPREVVKRALHHNAASVIFAHNHPSGTPEPSNADRLLTHALKAALALVDVRTLDHFIIAGGLAVSFAEMGWLDGPPASRPEPERPAPKRGRRRKADKQAAAGV